MNKDIVNLVNKNHFEEYLKSLEFWYLDTLKNIYHLPNMIKDIEQDIKECEGKKDKESIQKLKDLRWIQEKQYKDLKDNKKNVKYFEDTILYFNKLKW